MRIVLYCIGKTSATYIQEGIAVYTKRLKHYSSFETHLLPDIKHSKKRSIAETKDLEGQRILDAIKQPNHAFLLDDKGKEYTSPAFSELIQKQMNSGCQQISFIIGGAYGFSDAVYQRIDKKISFSKMTFSHELIRLVFSEQLYRAFSILNNEPYHHE